MSASGGGCASPAPPMPGVDAGRAARRLGSVTDRLTHVDDTGTARRVDRTGVEMEALTAVAAAGLALIDMVKAVDPAASLDGVRVLRKEGGKTGLWVREP